MEYGITGYGKKVFEDKGKYFLKLEGLEILPKNKKVNEIFNPLKILNKIQIAEEDYIKFKKEIENGNSIHLEGKLNIEELHF